ncbi:TIGR01777 family oxidoreductase [Actinokineospora inagensis]|uniref:TIGR01777 family oxidoreductase n=1 Tax=Actinokineospora inagensis TaxID=103730 RepID=UPI0004031096|nr:TIGR01777 family oxidoreductase [Actinokineospora inagensis]
MRVLVAGSSGLIGTALVARLRAEGDEVVRLVRRSPTAPDERHWDPPAGTIDGIDAGALAGVDAVVNLCGAGIADRRWSHARKQVLLDSRIEPTEVLAAAVAEHGIPVLVNGSAVGYYGTTAAPVDEFGPRGEGFLAEMCARWEAATTAAGDARVALARSAQVLAPRGGLLGPLRPLFALGLGGKLGDGKQHMPWIHLDDEVAALVFLLRNDISGPVNLVGPTPATNAEFTRAFAGAKSRPALFAVPRFALRTATGDLADEILRNQQVVPKVLLDNGFRFTYQTVADALTATEAR